MLGTCRKIPSGLNEFQNFRLFECAVKDDDPLVDAVVEKLYRMMKEFDASRAEDTVELIVDRDATAGSKFRVLLADLWPRQPASSVAA